MTLKCIHFQAVRSSKQTGEEKTAKGILMFSGITCIFPSLAIPTQKTMILWDSGRAEGSVRRQGKGKMHQRLVRLCMKES